jgi:hypothetical protein
MKAQRIKGAVVALATGIAGPHVLGQARIAARVSSFAAAA